MSMVPTDKDMELAENQKQKTINDIINFTLKTTIGKGYATDEQDVKNTRKKFNALGFDAGHEDFGYSDQKLERSIRQFQRAQDLKEDGIMHPNGETEQALNAQIQSKNATAPKPKKKPHDPAKTPPRAKPQRFDKNNGQANRVWFEDDIALTGAGKFVQTLSKAPGFFKKILVDQATKQTLKELGNRLKDTFDGKDEKTNQEK